MSLTIFEVNTLILFEAINSSDGITIEDLLGKLKHKFYVTNFISIDDILETNELMGRISINDDKYYITDSGKKYLEYLKRMNGENK